MNVLVTGDRGYIGSSLAPLLLKENFKVIGFDTEFFRNEINSSGSQYPKITKDIRQISKDDLQGIDSVVHLCALSNDPMGDLNADLTHEINYEGTVKTAKLAKEAGVKRFLFSSSCSIYGIAKDGIIDENSLVNPLTAYAKSKIDAEKELISLADSNFCVGIMRNSTVYGFAPKFRNDLVVNNLVTTALAFKQIRVMSDGTPWRPLIDVRDLSKIFIEFLKADKEKINAKIINVGFEENNFQVKDIISFIQKYISDCEVIYTGEHGKDARSYKVNFDKFNSIFPQIKQEWTLDKSIKDMVENLKKFGFEKKNFEEGEFTRLMVLKKLISENSINQDLYWVDHSASS